MAHQNFKMMLNAAGFTQTEELLSTIVCETENEDCMHGCCFVCPSNDALRSMLDNTASLDTDKIDYLHVQHWIRGAHCRLETII